jgi:hypothetical protein
MTGKWVKENRATGKEKEEEREDDDDTADEK